MPLVLTTETNPGEAQWTDAGLIGGGDSLALIIPVDPAEPAPAIDPAGRRNIFYVLDSESEDPLEVTLPTITPTLPPTWRIAGNLTIRIFASGTDTFASLPGAPGEYIEVTQDGTFASMTFVHDGEGMWAMFEAGGNSEGPPV